MTKDSDSRKYEVLQELLREKRTKAKLSQRQLAEKLGKPQSWVCRHEKGDLRLDYIELRAYLLALDTSIVGFVKNLESRIADTELD